MPEDRIIDVSFSWEGEEKRESTCFLGMSPAFEISLYTLCFLAGREENHLKIGKIKYLGKHDLMIKCFKYNDHGKIKIGSCFPVLLWLK